MAKQADNYSAPGVTIAFLGDSVTQGCFALYKNENGNLQTIFDKNNAYHAHLEKILAILYPTVPVNIINAGISGDVVPHALTRLQRGRRHDLRLLCKMEAALCLRRRHYRTAQQQDQPSDKRAELAFCRIFYGDDVFLTSYQPLPLCQKAGASFL